jgi:hypothetical protein
MHSTCDTNRLSTNKLLQALGLCHLPVAESCTRAVRNLIRCFPSVTGKGRNGTKIRVIHLLPDSVSFNALWVTFLNDIKKNGHKKIRQVFTYYLIQRHLILNDWHFWMTWRRKDTKIRQVFNYYLIQRHLILYEWHFWMILRRMDTKKSDRSSLITWFSVI